MSLPSCKGPDLLYENSIQWRFIGRDSDVVAVIEQVYMIQTVQKTIEYLQLQYINNMNDAPVVKIVQIPRSAHHDEDKRDPTAAVYR